jgi:hypothetical protein
MKSTITQFILEKQKISPSGFIRKGSSLNKAHVRWLEGSIYQDLKEAGQVILKNDNKPSLAKLSEEDTAVMREFKANIYIVLGTLGFMGINKPSEREKEKESLTDYIFQLTRYNEVLAKIRPTTTGFKVLKGARLRPDIEKYKKDRKSGLLNKYQRRDNLRDEGNITKDKNGDEILREDQVFQSPSGASSFILGGPSNGRRDWVTDDGKTLKEVEEMLSNKN